MSLPPGCVPKVEVPLAPHRADDKMDCLCHSQYIQRHSAADKRAALLQAEKTAIFLPDFRGRALTGVFSRGLEKMSYLDRLKGSL